MKNVMIVLEIVILIGFAGCGGKKSSQKTIIGKWQEVGGNQSMEFFKDGTVIAVEEGLSLTGNYEFIDDNRFKMEFKGFGELVGTIIAEMSDSGDEFSLTALGKIETYWRQGTSVTSENTKSNIVGEYIGFVREDGEDELEIDGTIILRDDGTVVVNYSGEWQINDDQLKCYKIHRERSPMERSLFVEGQIIGDRVQCSFGTFVKQEGASIVKTSEAPAFTLWNNYSFSGDTPKQPKSAILELKEDGTFVEFLLNRDLWEIKGEFVETTWDSKKHKGRIEGNVIIFEEDGAELRYVKQD